MRRFLPRIIAAGLVVFILYLAFYSTTRQWTPHAVAVHENSKPAQDIKSVGSVAENIKSANSKPAADIKSTESVAVEDIKSDDSRPAETTKSADSRPVENTKSADSRPTENTKSTDGRPTDDTKSVESVSANAGNGAQEEHGELEELEEHPEPLQEAQANAPVQYVIGTTKSPGSNYTRSLVIARIKEENVSWIDEELHDMVNGGLLFPAVYTMDDVDSPLRPPANKGHEAMAYLTYIIDHYDHLSDITLFMHAHRQAWHNNQLQYTDAALMIRELSAERVTREGYMNMRCHWDPGCPDHIHPNATTEDEDKLEEQVIAESWSQIFPDVPVPSVLSQPCCAQFAVSRDRIRAVPRERYVDLREWALYTGLTDYLAGRVFEYVWQVIFSGQEVNCPSMNVCFCDGYGICFGGPEPFDAWFETRYNMEQYQEQLQTWREKSEAAMADWRQGRENGTLPEEAQPDLPEHGKDEWLQGKIDEQATLLLDSLHEAYDRGKDPAARALEAGRHWQEGDGF